MSMLVRKGTMLHRASTRRHKNQNNNNNKNKNNRKSSPKLRTSSTDAACIAPNVGKVKAETVLVIAEEKQRSIATVKVHSPSRDSNHPYISGTRKTIHDCNNTEANALTSYGSFSYQLRTASEESNGVCEFIGRALEIIANTVAVTVVIICCLFLTFVMVIFGIQYLENCPKEPNIPVYLLVGGCFGLLKMASLLWRQSQSRRYDRLDYTFNDGDLEEITSSTSSRVTHHALTLFLMAWFALGNYWIFRIYKPKFQPLLMEPSNWCHQNVYIFALAHCYVCYFIISSFVTLIVILFLVHLFGCL